MIFLSSHAPFNSDGKPIANTGFFIPQYFKLKKIKYFSIYHSLDGGTNSVLSNNGDFKPVKIKTSRNLLFKSFQEFFINLFLLKKNGIVEVYIGVDPLNAIFGVFFKLIGLTRKVIFYTADYRIKRFDNAFLNYIYHLIDRLSCKYSDEIWNVSHKINDLRINQGYSDKTKVLPNTPLLKTRETVKYSQKDRFSIIIVSTLTKSVELENIINSFIDLKSKYKKLSLTIIGTSEIDAKLQKTIDDHGYSKDLILLPFVKHEKLIELLNKAGIGLALYKKTSMNPWIEYCDSMKARDYLASGLPVIISDFIPNSKEIEDASAGFAIKFNSKKSLTQSLNKILFSKSIYKNYFNNAVKLSKVNDLEKYLDKYIKVK